MKEKWEPVGPRGPETAWIAVSGRSPIGKKETLAVSSHSLPSYPIPFHSLKFFFSHDFTGSSEKGEEEK